MLKTKGVLIFLETTFEGRKYNVSEDMKNNIKVRSYKPVVTPEEKKRQSEYITRMCAQILKIRG